MTHAASGGVTHFAVCPDEDDSVMTIAWYVFCVMSMVFCDERVCV